MNFNKQTIAKTLYCNFNLSCGTNNNILYGITGYSTVIMVGVLTDNVVHPTIDADEILKTFTNKLLNDLQKFPELINYIRYNKTFNIHLHDDIQSICDSCAIHSINNNDYFNVWICDHEHEFTDHKVTSHKFTKEHEHVFTAYEITDKHDHEFTEHEY